MTTFGDGLFQYGSVPVGGGIGSMPTMGGLSKVYFVEPAATKASDNNPGVKPSLPRDTVGSAYGSTVDKRGDVIYLLNDGNATGSSREATLPIAWSNDNTHLVGCCAPTMVSQRARITPASSAALTENAVLNVSGHGNSFHNLQIGHWGSTDAKGTQGVTVSGNRNYFNNCHIIGIAHANPGDETDSADLLLTGEENTFENCYFGIDTIVRSTTNANVELSGAAARNIFKNCFFAMYTDAATPLFVKIDGAGDIDRFVWFQNCVFYNAVASGSTAITGAMDVHASAGGMVILQDCMLIGGNDWEAADSTNIKLLCNTWGGSDDTTADTANMGIAVNLDVTAA
jgi:hypothetical protein